MFILVIVCGSMALLQVTPLNFVSKISSPHLSCLKRHQQHNELNLLNPNVKNTVGHGMFMCIKCSRILRNREIHELFMHANILQIKIFPTSTNMPIFPLIMVRFSIRNHRWKVENVSYSMHANCLWPKFTKFSCHEIFLFYSMWKFK